MLWITYSRVSDIEPLANLTSLQWLYLAGNQIADVEPLMGLTNLEALHFQDNPLSDQAINEHIPALKARGISVHY